MLARERLPGIHDVSGLARLRRREDRAARRREALATGFHHVKIKVGRRPRDDFRRAGIISDAIGADGRLMMDANQVWDVDEAIAAIGELAAFDPWWIEEPTSPDDVLGHARSRAAVAPIGVATGEHVPEPHHLQAAAASPCDRRPARSTRAAWGA